MQAIYAGVDIGFLNTGVVLANVQGRTITPYKFETISYKAKKSGSVADYDTAVGYNLFDELNRITDVDPIIIFAEVPTGASRSARAARCMGFSTGVVISFARSRGIELVPVEPRHVKAIAGVQDKEGIMDYVRLDQPDIKWPTSKNTFEHIADAYCALKHGVTKVIKHG